MTGFVPVQKMAGPIKSVREKRVVDTGVTLLESVIVIDTIFLIPVPLTILPIKSILKQFSIPADSLRGQRLVKAFSDNNVKHMTPLIFSAVLLGKGFWKMLVLPLTQSWEVSPSFDHFCPLSTMIFLHLCCHICWLPLGTSLQGVQNKVKKN